MPTEVPDDIRVLELNLSDAAARRPVLAIEAARIFAMWANVELMIGAMASVLIGDNTALALLDRLRSKNQKLDGIRDAAAQRIDHAETRDLLKSIFKLVDHAAFPRNKLAHWLWGTIDALPDALLLTHPDAAHKMARLINGIGQRSTASPTADSILYEHNAKMSDAKALEAIKQLREGTEVWRQSDFDRPRLLLQNSIVALTQYIVVIAAPPESDEATKGRQQLRELLQRIEQHY